MYRRIGLLSARYVLHPTKKIDDEKDEEYRSKADIHKTLPMHDLTSTPVWARRGECGIPQGRL
jgi:hypothetical protein